MNKFLKLLSLFLGVTFSIPELGASPITIFSDNGLVTPSPWDTVTGGSLSDIQHGIKAGDVFTLFPTVDGPNAQASFSSSGVDPDTIGTIVKLGGFSASGNAATSAPLTLSASRFVTDLNLLVNINFTFDTPVFEDVIYWFDDISLMYDTDTNNDGIPDDNVMLWLEWQLASKYVASSNGVTNWVKNANMLLDDIVLPNSTINRIASYEKDGKITREWFLEPVVVAHPEAPADDLNGGVLEVNLNLTDDATVVPEPNTIWLLGLGLFGLLNLKNRKIA